MKNYKSYFVRSMMIAAMPLFMASCAHQSKQENKAVRSHAAACSNNPYLMKYNCSIEKIQTAAENGNADAQYALGYLYYYGIDTVQDQQTAKLWIQRSAAQGQPLAKKAWVLINSGTSFNDLHQAAAGHDHDSSSAQTQPLHQTSYQASVIQQQPEENVKQMNATKPTAPISNYLPAYHSSGSGMNQTPSDTGSSRDQLSAASSPKYAAVNDPRLNAQSKPVVASNNAEQYTLQLMASGKMSDVQSYISAHNLSGKAQYYQTALNGKPWYMVTYGQYPTQAQAQAALQQLPANLQHHQPWVKSFATIQQEVKSGRVVA